MAREGTNDMEPNVARALLPAPGASGFHLGAGRPNSQFEYAAWKSRSGRCPA